MDKLNFSKNWNGKLNCDFFTTFRVDSEKYQVGKKFEACLNDKSLGFVELVQKKKLKLEQVNDFVAGLDAGVDAVAFKHIVKTMYKNKLNDIENTDFCLCLFKKIKGS